MFKNKYLKQLQEVQALIKTNKANLAKLEMLELEYDVPHSMPDAFFNALCCGQSVDIRSVSRYQWKEKKEKFYKYLHDLGEYLINFTDYCAEEEMYNAELIKLQEKERSLKAKLGIE